MDIKRFTLNDLLQKANINPELVLVLRHVPKEPELKKYLPQLAAEEHDIFNGYQQSQEKMLEKVMQSLSGSGYIASFIGQRKGKAIYVGLYTIGKCKQLT